MLKKLRYFIEHDKRKTLAALNELERSGFSQDEIQQLLKSGKKNRRRSKSPATKEGAISNPDYVTRQELARTLEVILQPTVEGRPNLDAVWRHLKDMNAIRFNVKNFGYELARAATLALQERFDNSQIGPLRNHSLKSKLATQADMNSDWAAYWCRQLKTKPVYHRKMWELCFVPQAICERLESLDGSRGLGFGCGEEPLASLFAALGAQVVVTDLAPDQVANKGWAETHQHTDSLAKAFKSYIIDEAKFYERVSLRFVDMNDIPRDLDDSFEFCWSVCALEHLGSIQAGLEFIENSLRVLKPGGVAVHTTEFNYTDEPITIDNWPFVVFQASHISALADKLRNRGFEVSDLDFNPGSGLLDKFIDLPPFGFDENWMKVHGADDPAHSTHPAHMRLCLDGIPSTCVGIVIRKPR